MGKVDLAFDHITDNKEIQQLSVVLYPDSFFYGSWDGDSNLLKAGYHPLISLDPTLRLASYYHDIANVNVLSSIRPFVHLDKQDFEEQHFDVYFKGLYNLERLSDQEQATDSLKNHEIATLHYPLTQVSELTDKYALSSKAAHISTAMVNYLDLKEEGLICFLSGSTLHICVMDKYGFQMYNQYQCHYLMDHLYFVSLMVKAFFDGDPGTPIHLCGDIDVNGPVFKLLRKYFQKLHFIDGDVKLPSKNSHSPSHYYDLYLCKTCV